MSNWKAERTDLARLSAVLSQSQFLSEAVRKHPEWLDDTASSPALHRVFSAGEFEAQLVAQLGSIADPPSGLSLALFRRRHLLRIFLRDVLNLATLSEVTEELSNLACAILNYTYSRIRGGLVERYGDPRCSSGDPCDFSVLALGKLGGRELNYSSDIDLMFVYSSNGLTTGPEPVTNKEFFIKLSNQLTKLLGTHTREGLCYRVDLRLRPDGSLGEICHPLDAGKEYYRNRGRDWELQMLIKARVVAGEAAPGRELLEFVEPLIYSSSIDFSSIEGVSATRTRIHEKLSSKRINTGLNVKLARGGIRDIEFLVQCLQRLHGGREPWIRHAGTLLALQRLRDKDLLSGSEYSRLACAYEFLRHVEHRLQIAQDRQTHTLPVDPVELDALARSLPQSELGRQPSGSKLLHQLHVHLEEVQQLYDRVIHSQPLYYNSAPTAQSEAAGELPASSLLRFLSDRAPAIASAISSYPLRRGAKLFEHFLEKISTAPQHLDAINTNPLLAHDLMDLFENSPFFSDQLLRDPGLLDQLARIRVMQSESLAIPAFDSPEALRRYFRCELFRIQAASVCLPRPVFDTLEQMSALADEVVAAAYALARDQVLRQQRPDQPVPPDQMIVIALGRLGMREFDLGSDADLNFVVPDSEAGELGFWTKVAERMIDIISAYTGEGVLFTVDTRLRPHGREGSLVQTMSGYTEYVATRAEAWEGITYMKSRAVVGEISVATRFLHELQEVDWQRYGQSGRSRSDLREMRARLEREQGSQDTLKAGAGGYYDIDFVLLYLRLRSAGIFFAVLNTLERIDVIEELQLVDHDEAVFLEQAAIFYRAVDHALRIYSGHAEGSLPQSPAQLEILERLVDRWSPEQPASADSLTARLERIRVRTRDIFRRHFG